MLCGVLAAVFALAGHANAYAASFQLAGTVTYQGGGGVQNVSITATVPGAATVEFGPALTAADGSYQLGVDPGTYDIHFTPPPGSGVNPIVDPNYAVTGDQVLSVQLTPVTHTVSGTLRDGSGNPVPDANVTLLTSTGNGNGASTDANGHYSVPVTPGIYHFYVAGGQDPTLPTYYTINDPNLTVDATSTDQVQDLQLQSAAITVTVQDSNGNPIPNAYVNTGNGNGTTYLTPGAPADAPATQVQDSGQTSANGTITLHGLKGVTYNPGPDYNNLCATVQGNRFCDETPFTLNGDVTILLRAAAPAPSAPTNLSATTPTSVPALNWTGSANADHYNVYRDGVKVGSAASTAYTDTAATEGSHSYTVTAVDASGDESPPSNSITVLVDKTPPTVASFGPLTKNVTAPMTLAVPASDALSGIASGEYFLGSTDPGQGSATPMTYAAGTLSAAPGDATLTNLPAGIYQLNVRAKDNADNWSTPVTARLTVVLPSPTGLTAMTPTNNAPVLTWNPVPTATSYQIRRQDTVSGATIQAGTSTTANFTDTYNPGVYNYTVAAVDANGVTSAPSAPFQVAVTNTGFTTTRNLMAQGQTQTVPVFGTDVLPGLTSGNNTIASFDFALGYPGGTFTVNRPLTFTFNAAGHRTFITSTSIDWLVISGANNSQGTFQGLATATVDGTTTTQLPFTVTATDGARTSPPASGSLRLTIYTDSSRATILYTITEPLSKGKIKIN